MAQIWIGNNSLQIFIRRSGRCRMGGMSATLSILPARQRASVYDSLAQEVTAVVTGETNRVAQMATITAMLAQAFDHFYWTGFYIVDPAKPEELVIGPYQGTLGCLRIAFGRGVCGAAAAKRQTLIVDDVHAFPDHIACDLKIAQRDRRSGV